MWHTLMHARNYTRHVAKCTRNMYELKSVSQKSLMKSASIGSYVTHSSNRRKNRFRFVRVPRYMILLVCVCTRVIHVAINFRTFVQIFTWILFVGFLLFIVAKSSERIVNTHMFADCVTFYIFRSRQKCSLYKQCKCTMYGATKCLPPKCTEPNLIGRTVFFVW